MRRVNYKKYKGKIKKEGFHAVQQVNRRAPRRRPRDPGEADNLMRLAKISWDKAVASKKVEKIGYRHYRLRSYGK